MTRSFKPPVSPFPQPKNIKAMRGRRYREHRARLLATATRCYWCKEPISDALPANHPRKATADHLIPLSKGGPATFENLVAACRLCNVRRGNRDPDQTSFAVDGAEEW